MAEKPQGNVVYRQECFEERVLRAEIFGVADEIEAGGAGPRIENADDFAKWLKETQPAPDVCVALAARAALRVLPFQELGLVPGDFLSQISSLIFRLAATSWITAKYNLSIIDLNNENYIQKNSALYKFKSTYDFSGSKILNSVAAAEATACLLNKKLSNPKMRNSFDFELNNANLDTVISSLNGMLSALFPNGQKRNIRIGVVASTNSTGYDSLKPITFRYKAVKNRFWRAVEQDARLISSGTSGSRLADTALWHGTPPSFVRDSWRRLTTALPDSDNWWVWKNWYEDILNGKAHSEAHDMIYATVPVEEWDKGPAAANAWIAARLAELEEKDSKSDTRLDDFPKPLENVPSLFTFGLNDSGQIDIVVGPQNTPVIAFAGDEATHRQWLDTARELARRLAADLSAEHFGNVRRDYAQSLERYANDLPIKAGEGNFLLADHEIIAIHDLFQAEAAVIPETLAARLNRVLKAHYSLLDFYPETKRYHEAAQKGRLAPPAPEEAFAGFANIIRDYTPAIFAPRVTQEIEAAYHEAPKVEIDQEDRAIHAAIEPAAYPYDHDGLQEKQYVKASTANAIWKALWTLAKDPEKVIAYGTLLGLLAPYLREIKPFLETFFK